MHLRTGRHKRLGARIAARQSKHLLARADELLNDGRTHKACSACYENTYFILLLLPKIVCQLVLSSVLLFDLAIASSCSTIA